MNRRIKTHPILTLDTPLTDAQKKTHLEYNQFADTVSGVLSPMPSALPYTAPIDEIHDQFSPDADDGLCPSCGAEPKGFRVFALWFLALSMFIVGVGFGFVGGCEWHSHMAQN